ncbi:MAG: hypothetical protein J6252_00445, partial [Clostridia bacterium]|nr:hypothetical protein [Clostridia bacterium]
AIELFQTAEEDLFEDADTTEWESFCGKYEQLIEDFRLEEVFMQDGKLYAKILGDDGEFTSLLYPIGEKTFGRKGGFAKIVFGENCLTVGGVTCKKL